MGLREGRTGKLGLTDLTCFAVRLQFWLGGTEISLKDITELPPTANSENRFCRYSLVFCPRRTGKLSFADIIWFAVRFKFAAGKLA